MLSALIGVRGRAVPVVQGMVLMARLKKSQDTLKNLRPLRWAIPRSRSVAIVADRGFGRTTLFELLPTLGVHSVIRVMSKVWIQCPGSEGNLCDSPLRAGQTFQLTPVLYRKTKRHRLTLVLTCALIKGKVRSWLLATDLSLLARQIVDSLCRRFSLQRELPGPETRDPLGSGARSTGAPLRKFVLALAIVFLVLAVVGP